MPNEDLLLAEIFWNDTKKKISEGVYNDFWKISDDNVFHVRPKGINSKDLMLTPQGTLEKKYAYWLNRDYILNVVINLLNNQNNSI